MRRLVPLPFDQIRPALGRLRDASLMRFLLLAVYATVLTLFFVFVPMYMITNWIGPQRGFYVRVPVGQPPCYASIHLVEARSSKPFPSRAYGALPDPDLSFDGVHVGPEGLAPHLQRALLTGPVPFVYVRGDRNANANDIYAAIDQISGVDPNLKIVLVTPSMEQACPALFPKQKAPRK